MGEDGNSEAQPRRTRSWIRKAFIAIAVLLALFVIFHRPILRNVTRNLAIRFAAKENLKLDFQIDGSVLGSLVLRNVHATATGPSAVESIDAELVRADYSLLGLLFRGMPGLLKNIEVRSASILLDPSKAPPAPQPKPGEKIGLPGLFPEQLYLSNVSVTIHSQPQDFVLRDLNLDLNPRREGELRINKLQVPGVHTWTNLSATTSYANRNLFLRNLTLDQQNKLQVVNLDASEIDSKSLGLTLDGSLARGRIQTTIGLKEQKSSLATDIHFSASGISLADLSEYLGGPPGSMAGEVQNLAVDWHGVLNVPKSWNGTVTARVVNILQNQLALDQVELNVSAANGIATINEARLAAGDDSIALSGWIHLPGTTDGFGRTPADLKLAATAPDLKRLTGFLSPPIGGRGQANGTITIKDQTIVVRLTATGDEISSDKFSVHRFAATIEASKKMPPPKTNEPYYANLASSIHAELNDLHYEAYLVDSVRAEVSSQGNAVSFHPVAIVRNANELTLQGKYELPPPGRDFAHQPADLNLAFRAPQLADYWKGDAEDKVSGMLEGNGQISLRNAAGKGQLSIYGQNIVAQNLLVKQLTTQASMNGSSLYLNDLTAMLSEKDYIGAHGAFSFQKPHHYAGELIANIADLATLKPLLKASGNENKLAGSLVVNWQGSGAAATFKNTGQLKLTLEKGRYGDLGSLQANVDANYSPEALNIPIIFFGSDKMIFQAIAQAQGDTLEVSKIQVDQAQAKYAAGYLSLPFTWKNLGTGRPLFPSNGKVNVTFQSENLDLKKLFEHFGAEAPASGTANVKIDAQGTLADLHARFDLQMRELRTEKFPDLEPASFDLSARIEKDQLAVAGKLQQSRIQPVEIEAHLPFDVPKVIEQKKVSDQTPVTAKVHMPRSSVNFIREFVPALQEIDGDLALDVNVNGTIADPVLSGAGDMTVNVMRFTNGTLPALRDFKTRLVFNRDTLTLERFGGELAGGPFTMSGRITFPKLTEPQIDLHLKADSVLVARNDDLTARADADVTVTGPLQSASVKGTVALTNSQFLKNIDLIPIGLPGRPAPQPPSSRPEFSFPDPPLRDWKFDVAIKTKDPFLIRGNLANGGAVVDLKLSGTGLHPGLEGSVRLEDVEATLPFSRLSLSYGFLYFVPDDSLNPRLELHGTSLIRDYTIHVYVYGTSFSPEAVFTSEPPLPQEEIISLLATGTTRDELSGNTNVLAGRAAMLLVQQLYRKIFKKGAPTKGDSVFNRFQVELGNVDPRTGQQSATARFKINENYVLVGDIEVGGTFRGMVKYLIRFR